MNIIWIPVDPAILNGPTLSHFGREKNAIITSAKDLHNYVADDFPIVQTPKGLLGSRWSLNMDPLPHTSDTSTASSRDGWTLRIYTPMRYAPELGGSATHSNREGHINYKYDNWEISFEAYGGENFWVYIGTDTLIGILRFICRVMEHFSIILFCMLERGQM